MRGLRPVCWKDLFEKYFQSSCRKLAAPEAGLLSLSLLTLDPAGILLAGVADTECWGQAYLVGVREKCALIFWGAGSQKACSGTQKTNPGVRIP